MMRCFMTDDHKAAVQAFVEKRPPEFQGQEPQKIGLTRFFRPLKR